MGSIRAAPCKRIRIAQNAQNPAQPHERVLMQSMESRAVIRNRDSLYTLNRKKDVGNINMNMVARFAEKGPPHSRNVSCRSLMTYKVATCVMNKPARKALPNSGFSKRMNVGNKGGK